MTRKLPYLLVAIAAITAVSLLQAQDEANSGSKNLTKDCAFCNAAATIAEPSKKTCCESAGTSCAACQNCDTCENCAACEKEACPSCPVCFAHASGLDTHINAACESAAALTESLSALPGTAGFVQDHSTDLTRYIELLAEQLTDTLASGNHDPNDVRQLLQSALESASRTSRAHSPHGHVAVGDATHANATANYNQPLASAKARPLNVNEPAAYYYKDDIQYFRSGPEFVRDRTVETMTAQTRVSEFRQPATPVLDDTAKTDMSLRRLKREQESMLRVIKLIQNDMQQIAQDLSQLHAESRIQSVNHSTPRYSGRSSVGQIRWQSEPHPGYRSDNRTESRREYQRTPVQQASGESIENLRRTIDQLQQQLHQIRMRDNLQARSNRVEQAGYSQTMRLEPRMTVANMALTPAASGLSPHASITVNYYVGDLMQPPFASATLKLMKYIKANVAPNSWTDSRMMQITDPSISLVITQTRENQDQVAELLRQVRIGARSYMTYQKRR